jgi:hypothetical protein
MASMLVANRKGNYSFLRGIAPYSAGVVAERGYEIVRARFQQPIALGAGFDRVRDHLKAVQRPVEALCGMELRSPKPFTFEGFNEFNAGYIRVLNEWGVVADGMNPIARTNVAPEIGAPSVPCVYAFSYTVPSATNGRTFVVAGGGELPEGSLNPQDVVRRGESTAGALREKARFVMGLMSARLQGLGVTWALATATDIYTVHPVCDWLAETVLRPMGAAVLHGATWHYSRPPVVSIEYEMDLRGCEREIVLR